MRKFAVLLVAAAFSLPAALPAHEFNSDADQEQPKKPKKEKKKKKNKQNLPK